MIVRLTRPMDYSTAYRNVERAQSFNLKAQVVEVNTGDADNDYGVEVELNEPDSDGLVPDLLDINVFVTEVLRYAGVAEVKTDWGVAI